MRFLVITPARNEADFIRNTIKSMVSQKLKPALWVIVNDGSTDDMAEIVESYTAQYSWIKLINKQTSQEKRTGGSKVVRAFYHGYSLFKNTEHDVVVKLDADLTLPEDYFQKVSEEFETNKKVGLCGGYCMIDKGGEMIREHSHNYHVRGALKAYRKECWEAIGGFKETWNWDGIDGMHAMYKGWKVKVLDLPVIHHRPTSAAYEPKNHAFKSGFEAYRTGNDLFLTLIRSIFRLKSKPFIIGSAYYIKGFLAAKRSNEQKIVDEGLARFIRRFTYKRLLKLNF